MIMPALMHMTVIQLLFGWFAQGNDFHAEMQFVSRQRMIEVQTHRPTFD